MQAYLTKLYHANHVVLRFLRNKQTTTRTKCSWYLAKEVSPSRAPEHLLELADSVVEVLLVARGRGVVANSVVHSDFQVLPAHFFAASLWLCGLFVAKYISSQPAKRECAASMRGVHRITCVFLSGRAMVSFII